MIPVVCVLEWIIHSKHYSKEVKAAVMVVVIGVGICTVTDVKVNAKGFICACTAVFSTSLQQIVSVNAVPFVYVGSDCSSLAFLKHTRLKLFSDQWSLMGTFYPFDLDLC